MTPQALKEQSLQSLDEKKQKNDPDHQTGGAGYRIQKQREAKSQFNMLHPDHQGKPTNKTTNLQVKPCYLVAT